MNQSTTDNTELREKLESLEVFIVLGGKRKGHLGDETIQEILDLFTSQQALERATLKARVETLQKVLNAGIVKKKIGKYGTGEDKYQYSPDNKKIGAGLRKEFLRLAELQSKLNVLGGEDGDSDGPSEAAPVRADQVDNSSEAAE
jgi:hypothetical protein